MSQFKKTNKIQGNIYDLEDEDVANKIEPSIDDLESNLYSELEENDK